MTGDCDTLGDILKAWVFTYDGDGVKVKQEYTDSYSTLTTYYYGGGSYEVQSDGSAEITRQYYALAGVSAGMREGSSFSWFLTDHLGSVVGVTDADAILVSQTRYTPFGEIRSDVGTVTETDYGYTFQRNVDGMGLMDYKARYYSPLLGRFTQPDTLIPGLANPQTWNRYGYVNNNPLNFNDPSGHIAGCDRNDWACQFHWDIPVFDEVLYEPTPYDPLIEIVATIVWEPLDWMITIDDIQRGDASPWMLVGLLPVIPGSIGKHLDDVVDIGKKAPVVIGENMAKRVKPFAEEVGGTYYKAWKIDPFDFDLAMNRNERWIRDQVKEGREIIDIGIDITRTNRSPFYQMEKRILNELKYRVIKHEIK